MSEEKKEEKKSEMSIKTVATEFLVRFQYEPFFKKVKSTFVKECDGIEADYFSADLPCDCGELGLCIEDYSNWYINRVVRKLSEKLTELHCGEKEIEFYPLSLPIGLPNFVRVTDQDRGLSVRIGKVFDMDGQYEKLVLDIAFKFGSTKKVMHRKIRLRSLRSGQSMVYPECDYKTIEKCSFCGLRILHGVVYI